MPAIEAKTPTGVARAAKAKTAKSQEPKENQLR
jgi:hypothetical protein